MNFISIELKICFSFKTKKKEDISTFSQLIDSLNTFYGPPNEQ